MIGIYVIRNKINNKVYVGKSKIIEKRWKQYEYDFRKQRTEHINSYLLHSMNKHGYENFEFFVQEECLLSELSERELYWIETYNSLDKTKGYNLRSDTTSGMTTHSLTSEKISNRLKKEWNSGVRDLHSSKLKESWDRGDRDRSEQSEIMRKNLTKYSYLVELGTETVEVLYRQLVDLKLQGVISKFGKEGSNRVTYKGYVIERVPVQHE